jgi:hypothetical protein
MKRNWLRSVLLALALPACLSGRLARADEAVLPPAPAAVVADAGVCDAADGGPRKHWYPGYLLLHPSERPSLVRYYQNQDWLCCKTTHNSLGCSSLKSECTFIFGSCRSFFGEPCYKGKQPPPGSTGAAPSGQTGCNCP